MNLALRLLNLILFILFTLFFMKVNLFNITVTLILFSFLNSFILKKKNIELDMELLLFQIITSFYFERISIFDWREVPEQVFSNYDYIKFLFLFFFILFVFYLKNKKGKFFLKFYFYITSFYLVFFENILNLNILSGAGFFISGYNALFSYYMIDIFYIAILVFFPSKFYDKKFLLIYLYIILCMLIRYKTNYF